MGDPENFIQTSSTKIGIKNFYESKSKTYKMSNECLINVLLLSNKKTFKYALVVADIIWFSDQCVRKVKNLLSKEINIPSEAIMLSASHTHGTPNPEQTISHPPYSKHFDDHVTKKVLDCFKKAKNKRKKCVKIDFRRVSNGDFSINRRRSALSFKNGIKYQMQNLPNFKIPVDKNIDLMNFTDVKTNKNLAKIIKVNCHPVASPKNLVGSDYIGYLRKKLHNKTHHVFFLQGLCGDIRPKIIKENTTIKDYLIKILIGDRFRKPNILDAKNIGNKIASLINKVSKKNTGNKITSISKCYKRRLDLKLKNGETFKKKLEITIWDWRPVIFIFFNGEVLSGYNISNFKDFKLICVGYSNGMIGYLPTKNDIIKGGYEVDKSRINFHIQDRLCKTNESIIKNQIKSLIHKIVDNEL